MNFNKKILFLMILLFSVPPIKAMCFNTCFDCCDCNCTCGNHCLYGKTFYCPRSQNTNIVRQVVGHHLMRHLFDTDKFNLDLTITPQYGQSFKPYHMAEYFFATDCIHFSGSKIPPNIPGTTTTRPCYHFLADYFGLSPTFSGKVRVKPEVKTFLVDFNLYLGLDNIREGLFFEVNAPIVRTRWNMCICEETCNCRPAYEDFPAYYMDDPIVKPPTTSIKQALMGGLTWGDAQNGMKFGKIGCCNTMTKLADVNFKLGYLFINRENGYVGLSLLATAPTGNSSQSCCLFEPITGNCHHWELGVGFLGQKLLWAKDGDQTLHLQVDANFTHLFNSNQRRSFDFIKNGYYSRYTLLKVFDGNQNYTGELLPAINATTLCCKVKMAFQADMNIMLAYNNKNWEVDFGYNGWIRSREEICLIDCLPKDKYGMKGIQNVGGGAQNITQSCATIYGDKLSDQATVADKTYPQFINTCDLCIDSASTPKLLTHKFYWHVSRAWGDKEERERIPYVGVGWQIEFESINPRYMLPDKNAMYNWALWVKFGCAYG